jgi:hypothetical protein
MEREQGSQKKHDKKRPRTSEGKVREPKKQADEKRDRPQMKCFNCGKMGHPAFMCKEKGASPAKKCMIF